MEPQKPQPTQGSGTPASETLLDNTRAPSAATVGIPWSKRTKSYQWRPFRGMIEDIRRRAPFYLSDWTVAFQPRNIYRVSAATIRMYFINLMPALAYTIDMSLRTNYNYGVNETLLASAIAALVFPLIGAQPLTIVGVTGLINLFNYTNYAIVVDRHGVNYLQFQAWVLIWSAIMHWFISVFNINDYTRFITDMTADTFDTTSASFTLKRASKSWCTNSKQAEQLPVGSEPLLRLHSPSRSIMLRRLELGNGARFGSGAS